MVGGSAGEGDAASSGGWSVEGTGSWEVVSECSGGVSGSGEGDMAMAESGERGRDEDKVALDCRVHSHSSPHSARLA